MKLSVVMAVFNGARALPSTLESIAAQTERDFELIVVDDGSTDGSAAILRAFAERDARVRVFTQDNTGLTRALIRGCSEARADVIARHDCGDRSFPERFSHQLALLEDGHVLVSCATRFVDEDGDLLYVSTADGDETRDALLNGDAGRVHALPHHGSAMFRRDAYLTAGGYREQFRLAQDLDLWIRLAAQGSIAITNEVLYEATFAPGSLSGSSRDQQVRLTRIAVALRDGGDPRTLLAEASQIGPAASTRESEAAALYFVGRCLLAQNNPKGRERLRDAIHKDPWHWRARLALLLS